jgi:hypothetical protein
MKVRFLSEFENFAPKIIPDNIARGLVFEAGLVNNDVEAGGKDMFGVVWEWVPQARGSMVRDTLPPLVPDLREWEKYVIFPDLAAYDWEGCVRDNEAFFKKDKHFMVWILNGLFERLISFVGFENAALALVDEDITPHVHRLFDRLCEFYEKLIALYKKYFPVDSLCFHDDWGAQRSPFFSPDMVREMLLPYLKRIVDFTHAQGMLFNFHSCGKIEMLVPIMIEAGVDVWEGQEVNDKPAVIRKHAGRIILQAGPKFTMFTEYPDEDIRTLSAEFTKQFDGMWDSIIVKDRLGGDILRQLVNEAM